LKRRIRCFSVCINFGLAIYVLKNLVILFHSRSTILLRCLTLILLLKRAFKCAFFLRIVVSFLPTRHAKLIQLARDRLCQSIIERAVGFITARLVCSFESRVSCPDCRERERERERERQRERSEIRKSIGFFDELARCRYDSDLCITIRVRIGGSEITVDFHDCNMFRQINLPKRNVKWEDGKKTVDRSSWWTERRGKEKAEVMCPGNRHGWRYR